MPFFNYRPKLLVLQYSELYDKMNLLMKNAEKVSAIVFSIMFLFFSCSTEINNQVMTGEDNLKSIAAQKEKTVQWTQELEKNRLSQKIDSIEYLRKC